MNREINNNNKKKTTNNKNKTTKNKETDFIRHVCDTPEFCLYISNPWYHIYGTSTLKKSELYTFISICHLVRVIFINLLLLFKSY